MYMYVRPYESLSRLATFQPTTITVFDILFVLWVLFVWVLLCVIVSTKDIKIFGEVIRSSTLMPLPPSDLCIWDDRGWIFHSHSLPFPCNQFQFLPIPIPKFKSYSHSHGIPNMVVPIPITFPNTQGKKSTCKQSTVEQQKNSSTKKLDIIVEK